jgi:hypothetical protein
MDEDMVDGRALQKLLDNQEITEVLYRWARAADRQDLGLLATVYHPGAMEDHGIFAGTAESFVGWLERRWSDGHLPGTNHVITNVRIDVSSDRASATVESYFCVHMSFHLAGGVLDELLGGRYLDRFERRDGTWRITNRVCAYDWGRSEPETEDAWFRRVPGKYTWGAVGRSDPSYEAH